MAMVAATGDGKGDSQWDSVARFTAVGPSTV